MIAIRYAFMANQLPYRSGPHDETQPGCATGGAVDPGLPRLQLIACSNRIADPFDSRAVEA